MSDPIVRQGEQIDLNMRGSGEQIDLDIKKSDKIYLDIQHPTVVGVKYYRELPDKPIINDVVVEGSKTGPDYRLQNKMDTLTVQEIERIFYVGD